MANPFGDTEIKEEVNPYGDAPQSMGWMEAISNLSGGKMLSNAAQSTADTAEMLLKPVMRPDEFARDMGPVIKGLGEKALQGVSKSFLVPDELEMTETPAFDAVAEPVKEHFAGYTDPETFKTRLEEDPAQVALDLYSVLTGGAAIKRTAGQAVKASYSDKLPKRMLETSAKFSTKLDDVQRSRITDTLLREQIPITPKGVNKMLELISAQNKLIDDIISAHGKGTRYPRAAVLDGLKKLKESKLGKWEGGKDAAIIQKLIDGQMKEIERVGTYTMTLKELQEFKKSAYNKINWRAPSNKQTVKNEAAKTVAREAKEGIENIAPEVKAINQREGDLLNALEHVTQSSGRINNNNFIGMDTLVKPGAGAMGGMAFGLPPEVGMAVGGMGHVLGRPNVKGRLAQALYNYRRSGPQPTRIPFTNQQVFPAVSDAHLLEAMVPAYLNMQNQTNSPKGAR